MSATPVWLASIEALLNRRIAEAPRALAAARRLEGASLRFEVQNAWSLRMSVRDARLILSPAGDAAADVRIAGTAGTLLELALRFVGAPPATTAGVRIEGDAEVAARFRELLRAAQPDPEEELARLVGDAPARSLGRLARGALDWTGRARAAVGANLVEYLTEERRAVVGRGELDEFLLDVDRVREAADRLEARIARLEAAREPR